MNFYETVLNVLKQEKRFFAEDGTLLRNAVYEAAMQMDKDLIKILLSNDETKKKFFEEVEGVQIFDKVEFGWVINNRQFLPDSYTRFANKIGLSDDDETLISQGCWRRAEIAKYISEKIANIHQKEIANATNQYMTTSC